MIRTVLNRWKLVLPASGTLALGAAVIPFGMPALAPVQPEPLVEVAQAAPLDVQDDVAEDDADVGSSAQDFEVPGLSGEAWDAALAAYDRASDEGQVANPILTVIDYSLPGTEPRMWVVDMEQQQVLFHEYVAHGKNSGDQVPTSFSNEHESLKTSIGVFRTAETYMGSRGYSLKLDGLEPGVNDNARGRGIVIHGSTYVSEERARDLGKIGRSWGCPAVDDDVNKTLIDTIKGGSLVVSYYPDTNWLNGSRFVASR